MNNISCKGKDMAFEAKCGYSLETLSEGVSVIGKSLNCPRQGAKRQRD